MHQMLSFLSLTQAWSLLLLMMAMAAICIIVHILLNTQKRVAFHKIERSIDAHLNVEREYSKQVCC